MYRLLLLGLLSLLTACAAPQYTVDDGSKVNEALLAHIRNFGAGEQALRPAIQRSAALQDPDCDTQWELPFSVATSYDLDKQDRIAWARGLGVDERPTVVATLPKTGVQRGDKITDVAGYKSDNSEKMLLALAERRDAGKPFKIKLANGKGPTIAPFKVCRGYTRLAPPSTPQAQDYHWLLSVHPLQVAQVDLSEDEALWAVLWTQGVSEEGGARMKTYHYGTQIVGTLYNVFTIASGVKGAALAVDAALKTAQAAAANIASEVLKTQLLEQAKALAVARMRDELSSTVQRLTQQQAMGAMQQAAMNRGSLIGVAWVAATVFDRADTWAYQRMARLNANPLAGFALHQKLIERNLTANSLVFDPERMASLSKLADTQGRSDDVRALLGGFKPSELQSVLASMPVASDPHGFSYDDPNDFVASNQPFAKGLVDGMLNMPLASTAP